MSTALLPPRKSAGKPVRKPARPASRVPRLGELLQRAGFLRAGALAKGLEQQRLRNGKLGKLLVEMKLIEQADLDTMLAIQQDLRLGNTRELLSVIGSRLAVILKCSNCVSDAELERAFAELERSGGNLGDILVGQGALSQEQQQQALDFQKQVHARNPGRFKLGHMLVEWGAISEEELAAAIERQRQTGKRLGETLVESGAISRTVLERALKRQRSFITAAIVGVSALLGGLLPTQAIAGSSTRMQVRAQILSYVRLNTKRVPTQVNITAEQIAQGYADLDEPMQIEVKTNNSTVLLGMMLNSPAFQSATISGPSASARVTRGAPNIVALSQGEGMRTHDLSFKVRLELTREAVPGPIVMPFSVYVSPG